LGHFTVADEIGLTLFDDPRGGAPQAHLSPDGRYFAVWVERGRLDLNRPEDSLRFYRREDIETFLRNSNGSQAPPPVWVVTLSTDKEGPIINNWRWLADSSGAAFLERMAGGNQRLVLADVRKQKMEALTPVTEVVKAFDVRDRQNYAYTVAGAASPKKRLAERQTPAIVGTGHYLDELLFPESGSPSSAGDRLWAVVGGKRFEVNHEGAPIVPARAVVPGGTLVLSPDGRSLVTILPVRDVPQSWETLYPPPFPPSPDRIRANGGSAHQYVLIDLGTGSVKTLTDAPISSDSGWWAYGSPSWSSDGQVILLPDTFLSSKDNAASRPCVAVVDLKSKTRTCVEMLKGRTETGVEEGYHLIDGVRFVGGDGQRVMVRFGNSDNSTGVTEYRRTINGTWQVAEQIKG